MFKGILFFIFAQIWFEFLPILKIGYLFDLIFESLDSGFIGFLILLAFREILRSFDPSI